MTSFASKAQIYRGLLRTLGISLAVSGVLFHRRGSADWRELVFIFTCVLLQEAFLVLPFLKRVRPLMLGFYLVLPAVFVLANLERIEPHRGDAIALALQSPLPLVLLPVQLMVLYTRDAPRLAGLVLVLALFFVVAGLRRQLDDFVWPWLLAIGTLATLYMALSYPARLHLNQFPVHEGRSFAPLSSNPGGLVRGSFAAVVWLAVVVSVALSTALFVTVPRVRIASDTGQGNNQVNPQPRPGQGTPTPGQQGPPVRSLSSVASLADRVDLGDFGEIKKSHIAALELKVLRAETPRQTVQSVYLRAMTFGEFNGQSWSPLPTANTDARPLPTTSERKRMLPNARTARPIWKAGSYAVLLLDAGAGSRGELALVAEPTALVDFPGDAAWDPRAGILRAPSVRRGSEYGFECREFTGDYAAMEELVAGTTPQGPPSGAVRSAAAPSASYWTIPRALHEKLTTLPVVEEVRQRAWSRTVGTTRTHSPVAAARWLSGYFRNQNRLSGPRFRYSLVERPASGADCIYRFLTVERIGHCEYYASAMCMVLRAAGVPCRLAVGFHASKFNESRGVFEVSGSEAHAWVEVFVRDVGWIPFDPTPAAEDESAPNPTTEPVPEPVPEPEPEPDHPEAAPQPDSDQPPKARDPVVHFDQKSQEQLLEDVTQAASDAWRRAEEALRPLTDWLPDLLPESPLARLALLATPAMLLAAWFWWRRRKRKKLVKRVLDEMGAEGMKGATKRQRSLYLSLLLELARLGFHKRPHETPREFAWRVARRGGATLQPVCELTEIFYRIRFGHDPQGEEANFKRLLSVFAAQLRRAGPGRRKAAAAEEESAA